LGSKTEKRLLLNFLKGRDINGSAEEEKDCRQLGVRHYLSEAAEVAGRISLRKVHNEKKLIDGGKSLRASGKGVGPRTSSHYGFSFAGKKENSLARGVPMSVGKTGDLFKGLDRSGEDVTPRDGEGRYRI